MCPGEPSAPGPCSSVRKPDQCTRCNAPAQRTSTAKFKQPQSALPTERLSGFGPHTWSHCAVECPTVCPLELFVTGHGPDAGGFATRSISECVPFGRTCDAGTPVVPRLVKRRWWAYAAAAGLLATCGLGGPSRPLIRDAAGARQACVRLLNHDHTAARMRATAAEEQAQPSPVLVLCRLWAAAHRTKEPSAPMPQHNRTCPGLELVAKPPESGPRTT